MSEVIKPITIQPSDVQPSKEGQWWRAPLHFGIHVFVGTSIFGIIALAAVGLALLTAWVEALTYANKPVASQILVGGLIFGEYAVFLIDLVLFLVFLGKTTWRMLKEL